MVFKWPKLANRMLYFKLRLATIGAAPLPHKNHSIHWGGGGLAGISTAIYWMKLYYMLINPNQRKVLTLYMLPF